MVCLSDSFLRPLAEYPIYPPYHNGSYLEEYFFNRWNQENKKIDRNYIDIFWTNIYCNRSYNQNYFNFDIQKYLNDNLDYSKKYFTICQHDDGPFQDLPEDTLIFSAGGNRTKGNIIPIPLLCGPIPEYIKPKVNKDIFASFVGSITHQLRHMMINAVKDKSDYAIRAGSWSPNVPINNFQLFLELTSRSKFSLCPRGYGPSSFRMYEAFQLNSVPVYISDKHYLPWKDELNWNDFSILITENEIKYLDDILKSIDDNEYNRLLNNGKNVYKKYFTMEGMYQNIIKRLT
jgi:hypothetical protein